MTDSLQAFFAAPRPGCYLAVLGLAFAAGAMWFLSRAKKTGLPLRAAVFCTGACVLAGAVCARVVYAAVRAHDAAQFAQSFFAPQDVREFSFMGAVLGVLLGAWLAGRRWGGGVWEALTPPALLVASLARLGEVFVTFGTGQYVRAPALQFLPLSVPDGWGGWVLAVFVGEALAALCALFAGLRGPHRPQRALAVLCAAQVFLESLRAESIKYGFVRVSQLLAVAVLLGVLLSALRGAQNKAKPLLCFFALVAVLVGCEFGLDRLPWPPLYLRCAMAAACALLLALCLKALGRERMNA